MNWKGERRTSVHRTRKRRPSSFHLALKKNKKKHPWDCFTYSLLFHWLSRLLSAGLEQGQMRRLGQVKLMVWQCRCRCRGGGGGGTALTLAELFWLVLAGFMKSDAPLSLSTAAELAQGHDTFLCKWMSWCEIVPVSAVKNCACLQYLICVLSDTASVGVRRGRGLLV